MPDPRILTTVVGSYPVPDWLVALPSETAVTDATRIVIATQEAAGIDLVSDGELYRFDVGHPETNRMIEYFTRPMSGIRNEATFDEIIPTAASAGCASGCGRLAWWIGRSATAHWTCPGPPCVHRNWRRSR